MNKYLKATFTTLAVVGCFIIVAAAGNSDYYSEIGVYYPLSLTIKQLIFGIFFIVPRLLIAYIDYMRSNNEK